MKLNNPFDYFDAIYCINLDRRTDRWEAVQREFDKVGIRERVVRFSAIETPGNGAIGCLISHKSIIEQAKKKGCKNVLIFEDDIRFLKKDTKTLTAVMTQLRKINWDVFYLGGWFNIHAQPKISQIGNHLIRVSQLWSTFSVCYNNSFYDIFLKDYPDKTIAGIKKSKIFTKYKSIDDRLIYHQEKYIFLAPKKIICTHKMSTSDIQTYTLSEYKVILHWLITTNKIWAGIYKKYKYLREKINYIKK